MKKYLSRVWMAVLAIWLAAVSCNMPAATPPATFEFNTTPVQDVDVAGTAAQMALTLAASAFYVHGDGNYSPTHRDALLSSGECQYKR